MYISLLVNVSVTSMVCGVIFYIHPTLKEGKKFDVLEKMNFYAHKTETCQGQCNITVIFTQIVLFAQRN